MKEELIPKVELAFDNFEDMTAVIKATTNNDIGREGDYCVMVSREEDLYILSFVYSHNCDRNHVVFMPRDLFADQYTRIYDQEEEE